MHCCHWACCHDEHICFQEGKIREDKKHEDWCNEDEEKEASKQNPYSDSYYHFAYLSRFLSLFLCFLYPLRSPAAWIVQSLNFSWFSRSSPLISFCISSVLLFFLLIKLIWFIFVTDIALPTCLLACLLFPGLVRSAYLSWFSSLSVSLCLSLSLSVYVVFSLLSVLFFILSRVFALGVVEACSVVLGPLTFPVLSLVIATTCSEEICHCLFFACLFLIYNIHSFSSPFNSTASHRDWAMTKGEENEWKKRIVQDWDGRGRKGIAEEERKNER